jgi:outer membrane beta-barrel protein
LALGVVLATAPAARADEAPVWVEDPYGDGDAVGAPLISQRTHASRRELEAALLFSTSVLDKYSSHLGGMLEVGVGLVDTLSLGATFGYLDGSLTSIVTGDEGIIAGKVASCQAPCRAVDLHVPDLAQVTGVLTGQLVWAPLYGKVSVVSEVDVSLQLYALFGGGMVGTRRPSVDLTHPAGTRAWSLAGQGVGDGGLFASRRGALAIGAGLRLFAGSLAEVRLEVRDLTFRDSFDLDYDPATPDQTYWSSRWFVQAGVGVVL